MTIPDPSLALFALLIINGLTLILFALDKQNATNGTWRIAESTLLGLALLGGTAGAFFGRWAFRHKTRKEPFSSWLHAIAVAQALIIAVAVGLML